jgi:hemerythrin-like domain-containing protein
MVNAVGDRHSKREQRGARAGTAQVRAALTELEGEDTAMQAHLLDAAVAGATLARDPGDRELRGEAERAWKALESVVSHHLTSEDDVLLPWAASQKAVSRGLVAKARERHRKLRRLAKTIASVSFQSGRDAEVKRAARALLSLAVHLDDLIDGEERVLFPVLQRTLFARPKA